MKTVLREVEYAGYILTGSGFETAQSHPQFHHIMSPPEGYIFTSRPKNIHPGSAEILINMINNLDLNNPPPRTDYPIVDLIVSEAMNIAKGAVEHGANLSDIKDFFKTRHIEWNIKLSPDIKLAFIHSVPLLICSIPWVIEIEDSTSLFFPYMNNGETSSMEASNLKCYPILKSLLESENCKAIITHIKSTAEKLPLLFDSEVIRKKMVYSSIGTILPDITRKKPLTDKSTINLLFTNSWHQRSDSFFLRGGHDILEAFSILSERYHHINLIIRSDIPSLSPKHASMLAYHPRIKVINQFMTEGDMHELMLHADLCLIPAARIHVMTTVKALSYGIPVIASDGWGFSEYVVHRVNGMIIPGRYGICSWIDENNGMLREDYGSIKHPDGMNKQIVDGLIDTLSLLIENTDLIKKMSSHARHDVENKFSVGKWNETLKKTFDNIFLKDSLENGKSNVGPDVSQKVKNEQTLRTLFDITVVSEPHLVEEDYKGFNIVSHASKFYALSLDIGALDIKTVEENHLQEHQKMGRCVIGKSLGEVRHFVDILYYQREIREMEKRVDILQTEVKGRDEKINTLQMKVKARDEKMEILENWIEILQRELVEIKSRQWFRILQRAKIIMNLNRR